MKTAQVLNDLVDFIARGNVGMIDITNTTFWYLIMMLLIKLYLLLYVDDTVVLAESKEQL